MSSLLVCPQPAAGPAGVFVAREKFALLQRHLSAVPRLGRVAAASRLEMRPAPETVFCGIPEMDALTGGLPRGCLTEIFGPASSGRTSFLLSTLASATRRQESCALVDVSDSFAPEFAAAAGVDFRNLLWVRCDSGVSLRSSGLRKPVVGRPLSAVSENMACLEQALKVTDLLLQGGGFGLVAIDLGDLPLQNARRIPLTSWFRFRRAVENTPTALLVIGQGPCARTCASLLLQLERQSSVENWSSVVGRQSSAERLPALACQVSARNLPDHAQLLPGLQVKAELVGLRMERKPARPVTATFDSKTAWAG